MPQPPSRRTTLERYIGLFTVLRPGEGRSVLLFFLLAFLILVAYYILKTLREPLLLEGDPAEMKSYATATIAAILLFLIPLYGFVFRRTAKPQLVRGVSLFFVATLALFYLLGRSGADIGFAYYVWVGILSLMLTAQFWGYAADSYNLKSGQRIFPVVMTGATLGGLVGPLVAGALYDRIGPWNLMLISGLVLCATLPLVSSARSAVPDGSRSTESKAAPAPHFMGGLAMVFQDRYLLLLAVLIVILNWVNTTGEYILAEFVVRYAEQRVASDPLVFKDQLIGEFYGQFYFAVNSLTLIIQVLLVARLFRWIGVQGSLLVLPALAFLAYGLIAFVPIFTIIRVAKIVENSTDYSLMNTARHALYLPLSDAHKFEGKTAVETFFWRFGDLLQAGAIYVGLEWLKLAPESFAFLHMLLAAVWIWVAFKLGALYRVEAVEHSANQPPRLLCDLAEQHAPAGHSFRFLLPAECFSDPDPGDVLSFSARLADGSPFARVAPFRCGKPLLQRSRAQRYPWMYRPEPESHRLRRGRPSGPNKDQS